MDQRELRRLWERLNQMAIDKMQLDTPPSRTSRFGSRSTVISSVMPGGSSDITNRFAEFATLKAMGFPDRTITGMVLQQALILAHAGYVPGLVVAALLQALVRHAINLPITMTGPDILLVYAATCLVCALSALASVGKVRRADPADLFA